MSDAPRCPRCNCKLMLQPNKTLWCANCGDGEVLTETITTEETRRFAPGEMEDLLARLDP